MAVPAAVAFATGATAVAVPLALKAESSAGTDNKTPAGAGPDLGGRSLASLDQKDWHRVESKLDNDNQTATLASWGTSAPSLTVEQALALVRAGYSPSNAGLDATDRVAADAAKLVPFADNHVEPAIAGTCVADGLAYQQYGLWKEKGYSCDQARPWLAQGFDPAQAQAWKALHMAPEQAAGWQRMGIDSENYQLYVANDLSLAEIGQIAALGVDPADTSETITLARVLKANAFSPPPDPYRNGPVEQLPNYSDRMGLVRAVCHGRVYTAAELAAATPYGASGNCYYVNGNMARWFGPRMALTDLSQSGSAVIDFGQPWNNSDFSAVTVGLDPYTFTDQMRGEITLPHLRILAVTYGTPSSSKSDRVESAPFQ